MQTGSRCEPPPAGDGALPAGPYDPGLPSPAGRARDTEPCEMDPAALVRAIEDLEAEDAFPLHLSAAQWQRLAQSMERRQLATGDLLIRRGDRERVAYLLEAGTLQVFVTGGPPGSHRIARLRAGSIVGEPGLFIDAPRMASVEAMTPCTLWMLKHDRLEALGADEPKIVLALLHAAGCVMAVRMRANLERGIPMT